MKLLDDTAMEALRKMVKIKNKHMTDVFLELAKEKELHKCKCHDEQILIDYKTLVKADRMLFMVGEHGSVVLDDELRQQMIKCAADIRKCYMNMKGE